MTRSTSGCTTALTLTLRRLYGLAIWTRAAMRNYSGITATERRGLCSPISRLLRFNLTPWRNRLLRRRSRGLSEPERWENDLCGVSKHDQWKTHRRGDAGLQRREDPRDDGA